MPSDDHPRTIISMSSARLTIAFVMISLLAALMGGCALLGLRGQPSVDESLVQAAALVWQAYGRTDELPQVRVVEASEQTCTMPSGLTGFRTAIGCREGFQLVPGIVSVARPASGKWSESTLAHELWHDAMARMLLVDPHHLSAGWWDLSECGPGASSICGIVARANERLVSAGL